MACVNVTAFAEHKLNIELETFKLTSNVTQLSDFPDRYQCGRDGATLRVIFYMKYE